VLPAPAGTTARSGFVGQASAAAAIPGSAMASADNHITHIVLMPFSSIRIIR
jgi:hypothetical protein